ncbi:MAG: DNA pilot protein [Microviridae sp.]|nr:MAG: DNA pilot protein [Microviridae sp.]
MGKNFWSSAVGGFAQQGIQGAIGAGLGLLLEKHNDKRQIAQQEKLQALEIAGQKQMADYNQQKAMEMWQNTGYGAQKEQMKSAGLNPGLMYGMGGGGGQTTATAPGNVSGGHASGNNGEAMQMALTAAQVGLMNAQRRQIDADTEDKKAGAYDKTNSAEEKGLRNALTAWLQGTDEWGNDVGSNPGDSVRGQQEIEDLKKTRMETKLMIDRNDREKLLNNASVKKLAEEVELLKKKGLTEEQVLENLKKEGKLKDAEIAWNALDLEPGNFGKFITNMIKMLFKPR